MVKNRNSIFVATFIIVVCFFLAMPNNGYSGMEVPLIPIGTCCQLEGGCFDLGGGDGGDGPIQLCQFENITAGVCNETTGLCTVQPLTRNVPTLSQWGLIAMAGVLGIIGFFAIRRRKAAA